MDPSIRVRPFEPQHLARIAAIEQASFGPDAWDLKLLAEYSRASPELFLIASRGRRIAGYIITVASAKSRSAELVSIAVDPQEQGRGIGAALLDATLALLRLRHSKAWWLMVATTNETAIRFYERHGFARTRLVKSYYGARRDGWRMRMAV